MKAGCYTLDLYCDEESAAHTYGEFPHQYTAETGGACRAKARRDGWLLGRRDLCPKCRGRVLRRGDGLKPSI